MDLKQKKEQRTMDDKKDILDKNNIEIWEDLVNIKDFIIALIICIVSTFGGFIIAPNKAPMPLFFGLIGAITGFMIASILIKPKRDFIEDNGED